MSTSSSETLLISRIRAGEPDAWNEFIARFEGRLMGFVARRVANRAAAEDLVQDAFRSAWKSRLLFRPEGGPRAWLALAERCYSARIHWLASAPITRSW